MEKEWSKLGINSANYNDNNLVNGDQVSCSFTSTNSCDIVTNIQSNTFTAIVKPSLTTTLTISATGKPILFTAIPTNGETSPIYQWKKNGINTGTNSNALTTSNPNNGDVINCTLISNAACTVSPTVVSNDITVTVTNISVQVSLGPDTTICNDNPAPVIIRTNSSYHLYMAVWFA
jgi:hypothetical protein